LPNGPPSAIGRAAEQPRPTRQIEIPIGSLDPDSITSIHFTDLAEDFSLSATGFERERRDLSQRVAIQAPLLRDEALARAYDLSVTSR
jgi:hypothetical protein